MTVNDAVLANRKRRYEAGLMTKAQYERTLVPRGPEYVAPLVAYLCTDQADYVNGQLFHIERGEVKSYTFGEDFKALYKADNDGMFSVDELIEQLPSTIMSGLPEVVPPIAAGDVVKAGESKKAG